MLYPGSFFFLYLEHCNSDFGFSKDPLVSSRWVLLLGGGSRPRQRDSVSTFQLQLTNGAVNEESNNVRPDSLGKLPVSLVRFASFVTPQGNSQKAYIFFTWQMSQIKEQQKDIVEAPRVWYFKRFHFVFGSVGLNRSQFSIERISDDQFVSH